MQFQLSLFFVLLTYVHGAVSATNNFNLYAYGKNLQSGLELFDGDGLAYVGLRKPSFVSQAVNISFSLADDAKMTGRPNSTTDSPSELLLYIGADDGDLKTVGFLGDNDTVPDGAIVAGFGLFGGWTFNSENSGAIEMNFVASPTTDKDIYQVKWNAAGTKVTGSNVPISLRTEAPAKPRG